MKRMIFGTAMVAAATLSFCANAKEAPGNPAYGTPVLAAATKSSGIDCAKSPIVSPLANDRGGAGFAAAASCNSASKSEKTEQKTKTRAFGYAAGGEGRGQVQIGDGDRGSFLSFFTLSDKKVKATARKSAKVTGKTAGGSVKGKYGSLITSYANAHGVPVRLARAVVRVESNFRANARGAAGEIGLMQLKLSTARMMGYRGSAKGLYHPETNIKYGMKYLAKARQLSGGTTCGTILKYNAGHGAKRMNPISARYCSKVKRYM